VAAVADEKFKGLKFAVVWRFEILAKDLRFECKVLFVICLLDGDCDARAHACRHSLPDFVDKHNPIMHSTDCIGSSASFLLAQRGLHGSSTGDIFKKLKFLSYFIFSRIILLFMHGSFKAL